MWEDDSSLHTCLFFLPDTRTLTLPDVTANEDDRVEHIKTMKQFLFKSVPPTFRWTLFSPSPFYHKDVEKADFSKCRQSPIKLQSVVNLKTTVLCFTVMKTTNLINATQEPSRTSIKSSEVQGSLLCVLQCPCPSSKVGKHSATRQMLGRSFHRQIHNTRNHFNHAVSTETLHTCPLTRQIK